MTNIELVAELKKISQTSIPSLKPTLMKRMFGAQSGSGNHAYKVS